MTTISGGAIMTLGGLSLFIPTALELNRDHSNSHLIDTISFVAGAAGIYLLYKGSQRVAEDIGKELSVRYFGRKQGNFRIIKNNLVPIGIFAYLTSDFILKLAQLNMHSKTDPKPMEVAVYSGTVLTSLGLKLGGYYLIYNGARRSYKKSVRNGLGYGDEG